MTKSSNAKKEKTPPPQMGGNIEGIHERVSKARDSIIKWKKERSEINSKIKAEMEGIESLGLRKGSFRQALAYFEADADGRANLDESLLICREGMGVPVKGDQFDMFKKDASTQTQFSEPSEEE